MTRASHIMVGMGVIVVYVCSSSGVSAGSGDAIDEALEHVEQARSMSVPAWQGWRVMRGEPRGVQVRQGAWVLVAQRAEFTGGTAEFQGRVLLSGPEYSVRAEALTLTATQAKARDAEMIWRSGESMEASQVTVSVAAGSAEVIGARVGSEKSEQ